MTGHVDPSSATLVEIQQLLADHERRLYPAGRSGLPEPTRQLKVGYDMDGLFWEIGSDHSKWTVVARFRENEEPVRCVYIHTPHSLRSSHPDYPGDVVAMPYADARELAASILAAISHGDNDLARKRGNK